MKITIILIIIFVDEKYSWRFILKISVNALSIYGNYLLLLKAILRSSQYISIQYILSIFYHLFHLIETTFRTRSFVKFAFFSSFFYAICNRNISVRWKYLIGCQNYLTAKYMISTWGLFQDNEKVLNPSICRILSRLLHEILISYFLIYFWSNVFTWL